MDVLGIKMTKRDREAVRKVLLRAAERLRPKGAWTRGLMAARLGPVGQTSCEPRDKAARCWCLMGSLYASTKSDRIAFLADRVVDKLVPSPFHSDVNFNDAPTTTKRQVLALLRKARMAVSR